MLTTSKGLLTGAASGCAATSSTSIASLNASVLGRSVRANPSAALVVVGGGLSGVAGLANRVEILRGFALIH